jgi:hydrogenase maturation protease
MVQTHMIIGVGNTWRGDDGVGLVVAETLRPHLPHMPIYDGDGEGTTLLTMWQHATHVWLIDAVVTGSPAGTIHRFDVATQTLPTALFPHSTHAFGVAEAVEMSRVLNCLPPHLIIYGIEGQTYAFGTGLSEPVQQAVAPVVARIQEEVAATLPTPT